MISSTEKVGRLTGSGIGTAIRVPVLSATSIITRHTCSSLTRFVLAVFIPAVCVMQPSQTC
ncbi:MAG: hypothetical protein QW223_08850 [Candidatus Caldarchaeum sp.]